MALLDSSWQLLHHLDGSVCDWHGAAAGVPHFPARTTAAAAAAAQGRHPLLVDLLDSPGPLRFPVRGSHRWLASFLDNAPPEPKEKGSGHCGFLKFLRPRSAGAGASASNSAPSAAAGPEEAHAPAPALFPEDAQAASLAALQRTLGPDRKMPGALREAAASVEKAGRQLQYWVHRRQALAKELPLYSKELQVCYGKETRRAGRASEQEDFEGQVAFGGGLEPAAGEGKAGEEANAVKETGPDAKSEEGQEQPKGEEHEGEQPAEAAGKNKHGKLRKMYHRIACRLTGRKCAEQEHPETEEQEEKQLAVGEEAGPTAATAPRAPLPEDAIGPETVDCRQFRPSAGLLVARRAASEAYWQFEHAVDTASKAVGRSVDGALVTGA